MSKNIIDGPGVVLTAIEFAELLEDSIIGPWLYLKEVITVGDAIAVPWYGDFPKSLPSTILGIQFKKLYLGIRPITLPA